MQQARPLARRPRVRRRRNRALPAALALTLLALTAPDLTFAPAVVAPPTTVAARVVGARISPQAIHLLDQELVAMPSWAKVAHLHLRPISTTPIAAVEDALRFQAALDAARVAGEALGATCAVVRDGRLVWAGASGVSSTRDRTALAADSQLVIGSITKTFVAATILQLVDEGRLALDDPVRRHLPQVQISREITVRQLLDHTSGLADVFNDTTRRAIETHPERAWTTERLMKVLHAPWYQPGENWAYANTNYMLLGMIVEQVSGDTLANQLQQRFLTPLELANTRVLTPADGRGALLAPAWTTIFWGSGALASSALDLARWGDALYSGSAVSADSRAAMVRFNKHDYGLGAQRIDIPGGSGFGHSGMLSTYTAMLIHVPSRDVTVALLVNRGRADVAGMLTGVSSKGGDSLLDLALGRRGAVAEPAPATP